jgi:hypothetical protein
VKSDSDIEYILTLVAEFMGNLSPLSNRDLDKLLTKSLDMNCPNKMLPLLKNHRPLMYYPNPKLISKIVKFHSDKNDWPNLKLFYQTIGRKYYIKKETYVYDIYIQTAFRNKDYDECLNSFLDILDYKENILEKSTLTAVIYSNLKHFEKDKIFIELFEKALTYSEGGNFSSNLMLYAYYSKNKNYSKMLNYLEKLKTFKETKDSEILESSILKSFLQEELPKNVDFKEIISKIKGETFHESYSEILKSLKENKEK